jgi:hypothetical protein
MLFTIVLFLFFITTLHEHVTILNQEEKKVKIIHTSMMIVSFVVLVVYSLEVDISFPVNAIVNVLETIFKLQDW